MAMAQDRTLALASTLSGAQLREMFAAAAARLERHVEVLNAINVFPVPDGDTGINMHLTLRATLDAAGRQGEASAGALLGAMARGALMGARGNSGVILSQIVRGLAEAAGDAPCLDAQALAAGLSRGAEAAYAAVINPREGTMLTVAREAAQAASAVAAGDDGRLAAVLAAAVEAARQAVARTPDLLPVLREAGVVDAGGQGLCLLLEGALTYLTGEELPMLELLVPPAVERSWVAERAHLQETGDLRYGFCTEFIIHSPRATLAAIREGLAALGDSLVVVGDGALVRVHLHTDSPDEAIAYGRSLGDVAQVKADNIQAQTADFFVRQQERSQQLSGTTSIVAVAAGDGLVDVFRSLGATVVVRGGQSMNPSVQEILAAIDSCPTESVIVLPNNKNIVPTARQAAGLTRKALYVVSTTTIPQGVTALLSFSPGADAEANRRAMEEARGAVHTVEATRAVRSTTVLGVRVRQGQSIALVDGKLKLAAESPEAAVVAALAGVAAAGSLITIYHGRDVSPQQAEALAEDLRRSYPQHAVEVVSGGQPHYHYIVSLE